MSMLNGVGLEFEESMSDYLGVGETDPQNGAEIGKRKGTEVRFDAQITIPDLDQFLKISQHKAKLSGTVTSDLFGGTREIRDGVFNLFSIDSSTGMRQRVYAFRLTVADGRTYFFYGHKEISDAPDRIDVVDDMTRLFTVVYHGKNRFSLQSGQFPLPFQ